MKRAELENLDKSTLADLVIKAAILREAQKTYFRTRGHDALQTSKALEREFDQALTRVLTPTASKPAQADLFGEPEQKVREGMGR